MAADNDSDNDSIFSVNGYGTLGVVHSSDDQADYVLNVYRPDGAGYTHRWSLDVDSRFGIQLSANITPRLSAVWQVVSEQRHDGSYRPKTEWANLQYDFTPDFSVRIGRFGQPTYLFADTRTVGYAYPWVRPPNEMYSLVPVFHNDGLDVHYRLHFKGVTNTLEASVGRLDIPGPDRLGGGVDAARDTFSAMNTTEYGPALLRISYHSTRLTVSSLAPLFDAFRQFGPEGQAIADRYDIDGDRLWFLGVGASYDPGNWFAMGEWGKVRFHNVLGESSAWYVSGGYRLGAFTPFFSFARLEVVDTNVDPGLTLSSLPPALVGPAAGLNAALGAIRGGRPAQSTVGIGLRWDFMANVALKLQYEHIRREVGSTGTFGNPQPGFESGRHVNLLSASIDFVF